MRLRTILFMLCLVLPAYGQPGPLVGPMPKVPPKAVAKPVAKAKAPLRGVLVPAEVMVKAGRLARVEASSADGKPVRWINCWDALDLIESETGKWAIVTSAVPGRYKVACYSDGGGPPAYVLVVVGDAPPGPGPGPDPRPPIPPDPKPPTPVGPLQVLIVYESAEKPTYSEGHKDIIDGKATDDLLRAKCPVEPETKQAGFRIWDKDTVANRDLKVWQALLSGPRTAVPWVVIARGGVPVHEGPLPADAAAFAALLESKAKGVRK